MLADSRIVKMSNKAKKIHCVSLELRARVLQLSNSAFQRISSRGERFRTSLAWRQLFISLCIRCRVIQAKYPTYTADHHGVPDWTLGLESLVQAFVSRINYNSHHTGYRVRLLVNLEIDGAQCKCKIACIYRKCIAKLSKTKERLPKNVYAYTPFCDVLNVLNVHLSKQWSYLK